MASPPPPHDAAPPPETPPTQPPLPSPGVIVMCGSTGIHAKSINGTYDPSDELKDGYAVHTKRGDVHKCIEHHMGEWQIKPVSSKGKDGCYAYIPGNCLLEQCSERVWSTHDGQTWVETPSVKLLAGREAEQHIADRAAAVKQALQNDNKNAKLICLQGVCVRQDGAGSGIIGANGGLFNGWYEPVNEFSVSGRVIYVKRGGDAMCIEHHLGKWQLKNLDSKGTGAAFAYVYGACALEACVGKTWHVVFDEDFKALPGVKLLLGEEAEREYVAHAARVAEENARAKPVYISGALGSEADLINGFFEPTQEISGERVVYQKRGDDKTCIEHHDGDWEVKPVADKGKDGCSGYVIGDCGLEDCTSRVWCVHDGEKWIDQSDVVLLVGEEAVREFEKSPEDRAREKAEKAAALAAAADAAAKSKILAAARAAVSDQMFFKFSPKASRALRVLLLLQQSDLVPAFMHEEIASKIVSTVTDDDLSGCGAGVAGAKGRLQRVMDYVTSV